MSSDIEAARLSAELGHLGRKAQLREFERQLRHIDPARESERWAVRQRVIARMREVLRIKIAKLRARMKAEAAPAASR